MRSQTYIPKNYGKETVYTFPYQEYGILGFGRDRVPIKSMDEYIDHSQDEDLHIECCKGLALAKNLQFGRTAGSFIPEEQSEHQGRNSWTELLHNIEEIDPTGKHRKAIEELSKITPSEDAQFAIYKYSMFALGAMVPWFFVLNLKLNDFRTKNLKEGEWSSAITYFPNLKKYLESLPFKFIGRVVFFTTYPNSSVLVHRDAIVTEHKDHNINLFFTGGDRSSFIWDEKEKEKIYLPSGSRSYFFNNRDYHGVDAEPRVRYTLRIDGVFEDWLCEELKLDNGYVWNWNYLK
jgi:hypothetical protein